MKFHVVLQLHGKTATGFEVPPDVVSAFGAGKRPPVKVTGGEHTYRTTIAPMGVDFMIGASAENRQAAGVAAGDRVDSRSNSTRSHARSPYRHISLLRSIASRLRSNDSSRMS